MLGGVLRDPRDLEVVLFPPAVVDARQPGQQAVVHDVELPQELHPRSVTSRDDGTDPVRMAGKRHKPRHPQICGP
jgi:hypothetical protein